MWQQLILLTLIIIIIILIIFLYCTVNEITPHQILFSNNYGYKFNEELFQCSESDYLHKVKSGYDIMQQKSLTIVGLAYNIGPKVKMLVKRLQHIKQYWQDFNCVIYCYDSTDDTYNYLKELNLSWIILPTEILPDKKNLKRLVRMARLRNLCLKYVTGHEDYVMVLDYDLAGPISIDGIANSIYYMQNEDYGVMSSNGVFAYLFSIYDDKLGWKYYDPLAVKELNGYRPHKNIAYRYDFRRGQPPYQVISGFGGAALYQSKLFNQDKYIYPEDEKECEHVLLHEKMYQAGYKIGINPSMILISGVQGGS